MKPDHWRWLALCAGGGLFAWLLAWNLWLSSPPLRARALAGGQRDEVQG